MSRKQTKSNNERRQLFGKKSERLNPAQRLLFENLYDEVRAKVQQQRQQTETEKQKTGNNSNHKGRKPLPDDLPRKTIEIEPAEEEKICPVCHKQKQRIGSEETEKIEYVPASFYVKKYVRYKYACKDCESHIFIGQLPAMAIDKGIAGEGLLAHIITSKYADHNPLNRLEGILKRHGVDINVSTMCDWVGKAVSYSLNQWDALNRYVDDPILEIDNNLSERLLRMVVIGRKNYLLAGSETGARRASIIYSLVAVCKLNGIDPFRYFRDILARVSTHPADKIDELLPSEWKKLNTKPDEDADGDAAIAIKVA